MLIIEGVRKDWKPEPIRVDSYRFNFLKELNFKNIVLANAFEIHKVPYYWKRGKKDKWN